MDRALSLPNFCEQGCPLFNIQRFVRAIIIFFEFSQSPLEEMKTGGEKEKNRLKKTKKRQIDIKRRRK